jgi:hypothetical protein
VPVWGFRFPTVAAGLCWGSGRGVLLWSGCCFSRFGRDYPGRLDVGDVG